MFNHHFMLRTILLLSFLLVGMLSIDAQEVHFRNPSFEGPAGANRTPRPWADCGFRGESPPDLHPDPARQSFVNQLPYEGRTFLGMVTRDNNTWESVSASLSGALKQGQCYRFSIALTSSDTYRSISRATNRPVNYDAPVRLKIWGGNSPCDQEELLVETAPIAAGPWQIYDFVIQPRLSEYTYITFSTDYAANATQATNGNLLLDAASNFEPILDCAEGASVSDATAAASVSPLTLQLPAADFFATEENQRRYLANVLQDFQFLEDGTLADQRFIIEGETDVRAGSPQLFALLYGLQYLPTAKWELVVYDQDEVKQELKVLNMGIHMPSTEAANLSIFTYDPAQYDGVKWHSLSVGNGLYLLRKEE